MATWDLEGTKHHILICNGSTCTQHNADAVTQSIREAIRARNADATVHTTRTRCNGRCDDACVVIVYPQATWYGRMDCVDAQTFVAHVLDQRVMHTNATFVWGADGFAQTARAAPTGCKKT
ncbi:MAG: (2Fe-2S) ferredoxin domain-containing protein [Paenibacillaceae bacterium]|nr:(2Fe-2S) ferredoxin domain-containing protein [Paenibacillaceae bacterium]